MITACAELAKRLVGGGGASEEGSAEDVKPRTMAGWFTRVEKPGKEKGKEKAVTSERTLVVVG